MAERKRKKKPITSPPQKPPLLQKFAIVIVAILMILGFTLRTIGFSQKHTLTFDEVFYAHLGVQLKENPLNYTPGTVFRDFPPDPNDPRYMDEPIFKHPPLFPWLLSLSCFLKLRAYPYLSAIIFPMLSAILTIFFIFWLGKMLYDYRVGLLSAFFLAIDPIHWFCSEKIWMETTLVLFILLALLFFFRGFERSHLLLLSGLFAGLAMLTKYTGIIVPIFIFLFALFYKEELLFKRGFWLIFIIILALFSPWLVWNYQAYGATFLNKILQIQDTAHTGLQKYKSAIFLVSLTIAFLAILKLLAPKYGPSTIKKGIDNLFRGIKYLLPGAIIIVFIMMLFGSYFRQGLKNMWVYNYFPSTGWWVSMFGKEPWNFYFRRLLEFSPIYFFSFIALIFFSFKNNGKDLFLIFSAFLMMSFLILWGNYQSRYILPAVPILLILASRLQIWFWDRLNTKPQSLKIKIFKVVFIGVVGYFILKTINVGIHLPLLNQACYF